MQTMMIVLAVYIRLNLRGQKKGAVFTCARALF